MRLTVWILGRELLSIALNDPADTIEPDDPGSITSIPIGFTPTPGDQRWEPGIHYE